MGKLLVFLFLLIPGLSFSQFGVSEFYLSPKIAFGMGMNSYTYESNLTSTVTNTPKFVQLDLGSGISPEIALGFKITNNVYVESAVAWIKNKNFYETSLAGETYEQGYSFNRFNLQLSAKYYVEINPKFLLDFYGGISYSVPKDLIVKIGGTTEEIKYAGSIGTQGGFGGNYILGNVCLNGGIRYRLERFAIKPNQTLPDDFNILNPSFQQISSSGIDVIISAAYNF
jgi:hypothetical protein